MLKGNYLQLLVITIGLILGIFLSKRSIKLHEQAENAGIVKENNMDHGLLDVSGELYIPEIEDLIVTKDIMSGWNMIIKTKNFKFTPENVNEKYQPGEGHAHLYINGKKFARVYSPYFHIPELITKSNEVRITLNANGHQTLSLHESPIEKRVTISN